MVDFTLKAVETILSPLTYIAVRSTKRRNEARSGVRATDSSKPAKLHASNRRPLTPPLSKPTKGNSQSASPLLQRLPAELRLLIWEKCFEGRVHVTWRDGHLRSSPCLLPPDTDDYSLDTHQWCVRSRANGGHFDESGKIKGRTEARGLIAPVITCRRIYAETVSLLYAGPIFDFPSTFQDKQCLAHLPSLILPARLHAISTINIVWECTGWPPRVVNRASTDRAPGPRIRLADKKDHFAESWIAVFTNLASLKGLQKLRVEIVISPIEAGWWMGAEDQIFEPLRDMKKIEKFEMHLPWPERGASLLKEIDCTVTRNVSDRAYLG